MPKIGSFQAKRSIFGIYALIELRVEVIRTKCELSATRPSFFQDFAKNFIGTLVLIPGLNIKCDNNIIKGPVTHLGQNVLHGYTFVKDYKLTILTYSLPYYESNKITFILFEIGLVL